MSTQSLDDIRREIDGIDDAILDLLIRRFEATARVRATKSGDGSIATSPFRPAREAAMLRRLVAHNSNRLAPELLVRLWRVILSGSTQAQAPIVVHIAESGAPDVPVRLMLSEHFCGMPVSAHDSEASALSALAQNRSHLAVLETSSRWAETFASAAEAGVRVIGALPVLGSGTPATLIFGHVDSQPSGDDETILISRAELAGSAPLWQCRSGAFVITSLKGFLAVGESIPTSLPDGSPGPLVAGRLPRPIEVLP